MNGLVILIDNCMVKGCISSSVCLVYICSSKHQHLNQGVVVVYRSYLQTVVAVFILDALVDWKAVLEQSHNLV